MHKLWTVAHVLLSCNLPGISVCEYSQSMEDVDHTISLTIDNECLQQIKQWSTHDPVSQELHETIQHGWPEKKSDVPECVHAGLLCHMQLFDYSGSTCVQGKYLIILMAMQKEMMAVTHVTHTSMEGCIRRNRESMYWP